MKNLVSALYQNKNLDDNGLKLLIDAQDTEYLFEKAVEVRKKYYGTAVYTRGLIEFTNYCKNNCLYCGLRADNKNISRYRLTKEDILSCCGSGYELGFRTFVLQGGEDFSYSDEDICSIVREIKTRRDALDR